MNNKLLILAIFSSHWHCRRFLPTIRISARQPTAANHRKLHCNQTSHQPGTAENTAGDTAGYQQQHERANRPGPEPALAGG